MQVRVLLFGPAAAAVGQAQITLESVNPPTVAVALDRLAQIPLLAPLLSGARLAVNHAFAPPDRVISEGDEVALVAMVSGG